jgi:hypothetical protein
LLLGLEKIGAIEPFSENHATCWNNIKEVEALKIYGFVNILLQILASKVEAYR